jgi:2-oxoglutarate ferredoxin oxidoreductase subunit alpha
MKRPPILTGNHFMNGDHACAEGALAAGCTFFGGYPITPSTEIAERLAERLPEVGGVFMQMEDEMASMASILGASATGARAMTATSGPGFSLMMENLGLGVMMELPCVIVNVQRGSPSTGLPTLTGQSDIMQARWGSHGDYGIAAYSPWSPQEFFDLTIHAFNIADRFRIPVLLMADEVIPDASEIERLERKRPNGSPKEDFLPFYTEDEDLVPPMVYPGEGYKLHFSGLTHDEKGYPDMSADTHHELVTRLVEKVQRNAEHIIRTETHFIDDAEIVVIAFGSTSRSALRAVREAREQGIPAGFLRLISIWPFPFETLLSIEASTKAFVVPEMNLGQLITEVQRYVKKPVLGVNHAGGEMMSPNPILTAIREVS